VVSHVLGAFLTPALLPSSPKNCIPSSSWTNSAASAREQHKATPLLRHKYVQGGSGDISSPREVEELAAPAEPLKAMEPSDMDRLEHFPCVGVNVFGWACWGKGTGQWATASTEMLALKTRAFEVSVPVSQQTCGRVNMLCTGRRSCSYGVMFGTREENHYYYSTGYGSNLAGAPKAAGAQCARHEITLSVERWKCREMNPWCAAKVWTPGKNCSSSRISSHLRKGTRLSPVKSLAHRSLLPVCCALVAVQNASCFTPMEKPARSFLTKR